MQCVKGWIPQTCNTYLYVYDSTYPSLHKNINSLYSDTNLIHVRHNREIDREEEMWKYKIVLHVNEICISDCVTLGTQLCCHGLVGRGSKCCKENILSRRWFYCGGERQTKWSMTRMDSLSARNKLYKPPSWHWLYPACSLFVKPFIVLWNRDSRKQQ